MKWLYAWAIIQGVLFVWFLLACIWAWADRVMEHPVDQHMRILRVHGRVAPMVSVEGFEAGYLACERGEQ